MSLADDAAALQDDLVRLRRELHRDPELGLYLPHTQQRVLAALTDLPLEISTGHGLTSITAVLRGTASGTAADSGAVLLRADMDALPISEQTGLDYAAPAARMHACGHDLHTAMLVGAARLLAANQDLLTGDVIFMFQPGEEGHDGAQLMINEGVLGAAGPPPRAAYAIHMLSSVLPHGVFSTKPGPILAAVDTLRVSVHGRGGHAALPHHSHDPIPAACEMVTALQTLITRRFDVFDPVVLTVGLFHAGTWPHVIPDSAHFEASIRSFSPDTHARIREEALRLCQGISAAHGLDVDVHIRELHPVTVNDHAEADFATAVIQDAFGSQRHHPLPHPLPGSEDFAHVLDHIPGAFIFLGSCPPGTNPATAPSNHSTAAVFDDTVLADGARLYTELALQRLTRHQATPQTT